MAGTYLGIASAGLKQAIAHMGRRHYDHSGASLAQVPILQHRVGELWSQVERTRRLVYYSAEQGDTGGENALPAIFSAKADAGECAVGVINEVLTLMGGISYREGSKIDRLLRDARAAHVMAPTTDILRTWTGRVLLGQALLGD
jgi:alkylation response protein AidB-like acyl-CoA dehydrogenase